MSWSSSTQKITGNVEINDVRKALVVSSRDIGGVMINGSSRINKWAKWKPVKYYYDPDALNLETEAKRKAGGQLNAQDTGVVYGLRGGISNVGRITALHSLDYTYEAPTSWGSGCAYRITDFAYPATSVSDRSTTRGYYHGATFNLRAEPYTGGGQRIWIGAEGALYVNLYFTPRASHDQDAIAVEDFLDNNGIQYNPLDCYPCILISTATGNHYVHCLYPANVTALTTLRNNPQGYYGASWRLDLSGTDTPQGLGSSMDNTTWTWTVFLVNSRYLNPADTTNTDISAWIYDTNAEGGSTVVSGVQRCGLDVDSGVWASWPTNIPGAIGLQWTARTNTLPFLIPDSYTDMESSNGFNISAHFSGEYQGEVTWTISVTLYSDSDRTTEVASASYTDTYTLATGRAMAVFHLFKWEGTDTDCFNLMQLPQDTTYYARVYGSVSVVGQNPNMSAPYDVDVVMHPKVINNT